MRIPSALFRIPLKMHKVRVFARRPCVHRETGVNLKWFAKVYPHLPVPSRSPVQRHFHPELLTRINARCVFGKRETCKHYVYLYELPCSTSAYEIRYILTNYLVAATTKIIYLCMMAKSLYFHMRGCFFFFHRNFIFYSNSLPALI